MEVFQYPEQKELFPREFIGNFSLVLQFNEHVSFIMPWELSKKDPEGISIYPSLPLLPSGMGIREGLSET